MQGIPGGSSHSQGEATAWKQGGQFAKLPVLSAPCVAFRLGIHGIFKMATDSLQFLSTRGWVCFPTSWTCSTFVISFVKQNVAKWHDSELGPQVASQLPLSPSWNTSAFWRMERAQGDGGLAILAQAPNTCQYYVGQPSPAQPSLIQTDNPQNYEQISNCCKSLYFGEVCYATNGKMIQSLYPN